MKYKSFILTIFAASFLIGCSDSQNKTPQEKNLAKATTQTHALAPEQKTDTPSDIITKEANAIPPQDQHNIEDVIPPQDQRNIEQDAQSITASLIEKGSKTPKKELEQKVKKALEAALARSPTASGTTK